MSDPRPAADTAPENRSPLLRAVPSGQDAAVDRLLERLRPWALRQAARSYGHLPEADRVTATDLALRDLRARGVADDLRAARVAVADGLTARLRSAHVAWCHRPSALDAPPPSTPRAPDTVADVVERGLKGLERAVLQLEIGAGRDTRTARAALRLGPRDYTRHRREGLVKLRAAIGGQVDGHVCEAHRADVVLAATGDDAALQRLGAGPGRCRSCSREARGLRRLLHQRLALAPWPLTIKPMGALAAKLAGLGGAAAGTATVAAGGGGSGLLGGAAGGVAATVAGIAAIAGGSAVVASGADAEKPRPAAQTRTAEQPAARPAPTLASAAATRAATPAPRRSTAKTKAEGKAQRVRAARSTTATSRPGRSSAPARPTPAATAAPASPAPSTSSAPASTPAPVAPAATPGALGKTTRGVTDTVTQVAAPVTGALPQPVQDTVQGVTDTVNGVGDAVDQTLGGLAGALAPKP